MRSHERLNRRSTSISGKCYQVTESGVTEPGLQAGSPPKSGFDLQCSIEREPERAHFGHICLRLAEGVAERVTSTGGGQLEPSYPAMSVVPGRTPGRTCA